MNKHAAEMHYWQALPLGWDAVKDVLARFLRRSAIFQSFRFKKEEAEAEAAILNLVRRTASVRECSGEVAMVDYHTQMQLLDTDTGSGLLRSVILIKTMSLLGRLITDKGSNTNQPTWRT